MAEITGTGIPTSSTKGCVGDIYTDTLTNSKYTCVLAYLAKADDGTEEIYYKWSSYKSGGSGESGPQGPKGEDGITPNIGANGHWYIGDEDTGVPSTGAKGDKGDTGAKGSDGKTPVKGTDYWTADDKEEIVNDVLAQIPNGNEVAY